MKKLVAVLAVLALVAAVLRLLPEEQASAPATPEESASARRDSAADAAAGGAPRQRLPLPGRDRETEEPAPALSLEGTEVGGGLLVDEAGNFVPTADAVAMFEYFLSTAGELTPEQILARIRAEIGRRLAEPARAQALAFLDRYMSYREQARLLGTADSEDADLRPRFERLAALRRQMFGEEVSAALFGEEEAAAEVAIAQREIAADPNRSDEEKAALIEELYQKLPEPLRKAREDAMAAIRLREDEAALRAAGAGAEEIRRLRVERFGEEAADRLEDLDREEAEWEDRLAGFRSDRDRILADPSLTPQQRQAAAERLLAERFDERERIRVEALDRMQ